MAKIVSFQERAWAFAVHAPIITIIWVSFIAYKMLRSSEPIFDFIQRHLTTSNSLPITPLLFTLLTVPISLFIHHMQRQSSFVKTHAHQAYIFNISLLQWYASCFGTILIAQFFHAPIITKISVFIVSCVSLNCFIQASFGMRAVTMGNPFKYRYLMPWVVQHFSRW